MMYRRLLTQILLAALAAWHMVFAEPTPVPNPGTCQFQCVRDTSTEDESFHFKEIGNRCGTDELCTVPQEGCDRDSIGKYASELCKKAECHIRYFRDAGKGKGDCESEDLEPLCTGGRLCVDNSPKFNCNENESVTNPGFCR